MLLYPSSARNRLAMVFTRGYGIRQTITARYVRATRGMAMTGERKPREIRVAQRHSAEEYVRPSGCFFSARVYTYRKQLNSYADGRERLAENII